MSELDDIMEYKILYSKNPENLTKKVNEALKDGWECWGGITAGQMNNSMILFQAVMK